MTYRRIVGNTRHRVRVGSFHSVLTRHRAEHTIKWLKIAKIAQNRLQPELENLDKTPAKRPARLDLETFLNDALIPVAQL
jgi:hypothetical protein